MSTIDLSSATLLGSGNERRCYVHPFDKTKCIKVNKPNVVYRSQNKIEFYYINKLLRRKVPFTHLPAFYGKVSTNLGIGLIYERITNPDGTPALQLNEMLNNGEISKQDAAILLDNLKKYCLKYAICVSDINEDQILIKKQDDNFCPVIIDGIGTRRYGFKLFAVANILYFARRKTIQKWPLLLKKLNI